MSFYSNLATTASRLIVKYGKNLILVRGNDSTDPVTGVTTSGATRRYQVNAMLKNYPDSMVDGTRIKTGDRLIILDGKTEPLITDKIRLQSHDWDIVNLTTSNPATTVLVYFAQVRK